MKISFIGAGNVATHLARALHGAGHEIVGVHTRSLHSAEPFAATYQCTNAASLAELPESDIYLFAIKDDALQKVVHEFGQLHRAGLCVHTAGSVPIDIFKDCINRYGVFYPMQTFSKDKILDYSMLPLFIEANNEEDHQYLMALAHEISGRVYPLDSEGRKQLHLSAVFACNFSNHCVAVAQDLLSKIGLPSDLLLPLIDETCQKLHALPAADGQTGPAVRYDQNVLKRQMAMLSNDPLRQEIYRLISESIHDYAERRKS